MKKNILSFISFFLCALLFMSCGQKLLKDQYGCFLDYDQTISYASKKNKPILIFFTSQGDDEKSTQLVNNVLNGESFKKSFASKYAVLHADFSQNTFEKTLAPENANDQEVEEANTYTNILQNNYKLAILFNVSQMPAVFLCSPQGYVIDRLDAEKTINSIEDLQTLLDSKKEEIKNFNSMVSQTKKGSVSNKVEAIDTIYNATQSEYRAFLLPLVNYAVEIDTDNTSGLAGKFILSKAEIEAIFAYSSGDVESAVQKYLVAADNKFVKTEDKQDCFYKAAYLLAYSDSSDYETIVYYLEMAYKIAPESSKAESIQKAIEYFKDK